MAIDPEILQQFKQSGPCLSIGAELWTIQGRKLTVGTVTRIFKDKVEVRGSGGLRTIDPADILIFTTPKKGTSPTVKKGK